MIAKQQLETPPTNATNTHANSSPAGYELEMPTPKSAPSPITSGSSRLSLTCLWSVIARSIPVADATNAIGYQIKTNKL